MVRGRTIQKSQMPYLSTSTRYTQSRNGQKGVNGATQELRAHLPEETWVLLDKRSQILREL